MAVNPLTQPVPASVLARLPIEMVPGARPPKFRWRQVVSTPGGDRMVDHEGALPPSLEGAVATLIREAKYLESAYRALQERVAETEKFKAWVHAYLDARGVPQEFPDGPHTAEGCRIGDRLDWLMAQIPAAGEGLDKLVAPEQPETPPPDRDEQARAGPKPRRRG